MYNKVSRYIQQSIQVHRPRYLGTQNKVSRYVEQGIQVCKTSYLGTQNKVPRYVEQGTQVCRTRYLGMQNKVSPRYTGTQKKVSRYRVYRDQQFPLGTTIHASSYPGKAPHRIKVVEQKPRSAVFQDFKGSLQHMKIYGRSEYIISCAHPPPSSSLSQRIRPHSDEGYFSPIYPRRSSQVGYPVGRNLNLCLF